MHARSTQEMAAPFDSAAFSELRIGFTGEFVRPTDASFDELRKVWNGSIDRHPALIARCAGADDIAAATRFARRTGLPVAVRGGGHSFPGLSVCDDGIVIDLAPMKGISVDPEARTVRVQAGVLLGELDRATQPFGLAVPSGIVTHTGVAGLTLGGGIGWVMRKYGLSIDQLSSVELITAEGERVTASDAENADLFWGVRGGGGNFGIVTAVRLPPLRRRPDRRRGPDLLAHRAVAAGPALLPRLDRRRARRADDHRDPSQGAAAPVRSPRAARQAHRRRGLLLHGTGRGGRARRAPDQGVRFTGARPVRAEAVHRSPGDVRPVLPARSLVLLPLLRRRRADRRGHRHHRRAHEAHPVAADELPHLAARRRGGAGRRGRDGLQRPQRRAHVQHRRGRPRRPTASTRNANGCATSGRP